MTDEQLLALDKEGFIPGPGEKEEDFLIRVARIKEKFHKGEWIPSSHWEWVREYLGELFNVKPLYICAFYSNRSLTPWQGAASWIEGRELQSIQLRKALKKGTYLRLYKREEILAHEAVHAARSGFDENRYEEFFAYMTSETKWRRILGPILERPWEVWPLLSCLLLGIMWPSCYLGAAIWIGLGFRRLIRRHRTLKLAANHILKKVGDPHKARAVLFRLTDQEIEQFAKGEKVIEEPSLRWRIIRSYLERPQV